MRFNILCIVRADAAASASAGVQFILATAEASFDTLLDAVFL